MGKIIPDAVYALFNRLTGHAPPAAPAPSVQPDLPVDHPFEAHLPAPRVEKRTIWTFDIQGTLELPPSPTNLAPHPNTSLFHFMLDTAANRDDNLVLIVTLGDTDNALDRMQNYAAMLGRDLGDVKVIYKPELDQHVSSVDVAIDNEKFDYLPALGATEYEVTIDKQGNPDLPLSYLREKFGIPELFPQPPATTPPAPTAPQ